MAVHAQPTAENVTLLHEEPGFVIAAARDVMFVLWAKRCTTDSALKLEAACRSLAERYGQFSSIHVAMNGVPLPESAARETLTAVSQRVGSQTIAVAVVLLGQGFWASAVRAFVTSLRWGGVSATPFKVHVCAAPEDATLWLSNEHGARSTRKPSALELDAALREALAHPHLAVISTE